MMNRAEKASLVKLKLLRLLEQYNQLKTEVEKLSAQNEKLLLALNESRKREEIAQERNKISKLADGIQLNGLNRNEIKQYLNSYIRQIDECQKLLNQLSDNT
jgi:hypothetical protein